VFRHLFGLGTQDILHWTVQTYQDHRAFADAWLTRNGMKIG